MSSNLPPNPPNRRAYPRLKAPVFFREVRLVYFGSQNKVVDVSMGGFRIYSDDAMKVGQRLELAMNLPDGDPLACEATVAWIKPLPKGAVARYDVGLQFVHASLEMRARLAAVLSSDDTGES